MKNVSGLAQFLREGHCLTNSVCKDCSAPLLRMRSTDTLFCGMCSKGEKKSAEKAFSREETSKLLGEYLLGGYSMLSVNCDACNAPLMQKVCADATCIPVCVNCQSVSIKEAPASEQQSISHSAVADADERMGKLMAAGWILTAQVCDTCQTPLLRNRKTLEVFCVSKQNTIVVNVNETAVDLGKLLIEGWTMLAEDCAICRVPLMLKDNFRLCVSCKK